MPHNIIETFDDTLGMESVGYVTSRDLVDVATEKYNYWRGMVGYEFPSETKVNLYGPFDGKVFLVIRYPEGYGQDMGYGRDWQCDTFHAEPTDRTEGDD